MIIKNISFNKAQSSPYCTYIVITRQCVTDMQSSKSPYGFTGIEYMHSILMSLIISCTYIRITVCITTYICILINFMYVYMNFNFCTVGY